MNAVSELQSQSPCRGVRTALAAAVAIVHTLVCGASSYAQSAGAASAMPTAPASPAPTLCNRTDLSRPSLRTLDATLISIEPPVTSLAWAPPDPATRRGWTLVLGDPSSNHCRALVDCTEERGVVHGPFAGFASSSAAWTARLVCGERLALVVLDSDGTPRAARDAGEDHSGEDGWTGAGTWLRSVAAFPDGASLVVGTYMTADGISTYALRVMSGFDGRLAELLSTSMNHTMGASHEFTIEPDGPPRARPALRVVRRRGRLRWDDTIDDNRAVLGPARTERRVFDARRRRFR